MSKLFLNRIQDLISVINPNALKIFLNTLSKSDLEHAYIFAYALPRGNDSMGLMKATVIVIRRTTVFVIRDRAQGQPAYDNSSF